MRYNRLPCVPLLLFAMLLPASAEVRYVDAQASTPVPDGTSWRSAFRRVQDGLDAAQPGDEVWVRNGGYPETLRLTKPGVGLYGRFSGTETARDQRDLFGTSLIAPVGVSGAIVTITPEATGAVVDGLHIFSEDRGAATGVRNEARDVIISNNIVRACGVFGGEGGGIHCTAGSSANIVSNSLVQNRARLGAGVFVFNASATMLGNDIRSNVAGDGVGDNLDYTKLAQGGGIYAAGSSTVVIRGNFVNYNGAREGGGIWIDRSTVEIAANTVSNNIVERQAGEDWPNSQAAVESRGGGMGLTGVSGMVHDNVVSFNTAYAQAPLSTGLIAQASGGGILAYGGDVLLANNTVAYNAASATGAAQLPYVRFTTAEGGGIFAMGDIVVANNVLVGNQTAVPIGYGYVGDAALDGTMSGPVASNLFYPSPPNGEWVGQNGNIGGDPLLDAYLQPRPGSPMIDRGETSFVRGGTDRDGNPRVRGARVDIGAFEAEVPDAPARVFVSPAGDDANAGTSWAAAKRTVAAALSAVGMDGEVWAAAGSYPEHAIYFYSRVGLYGGFQGNETERSQRDARAHPTVLDAGKQGRVLEIPAGAGRVTVDGFTIQNGGATWPLLTEGAGIRCAGTDITLSNNVIRDNAVDFAANNPGAAGGGLVMNGGSLTLDRNVFSGNLAAVTQTASYPQFSNYALAYGGAAYLANGRVTVTNNLFLKNVAAVGSFPTQNSASGGALYQYGTTGVIAGNTFVGNAARLHISLGTPGGDLPGGAMGLGAPDPNLVVANNIVAFNGSGIWALNRAPAWSHNDVFANTRENYFGVPDPTGTDGNISADPLFVDGGTSDYRLSPDSPARDAGDNAAALGAMDLAGSPRIQGGTVDIGAYEFLAPGALTLADAARALRIAAGLAWATPEDMARLNGGGTSPIGVPTAVAVARKAAGRGPNP